MKRALIGLAVAAVLGSAPSPALPANFTVTSCSATSANAAWTPAVTRPDLLEAVATCPPGTERTGGLIAQERLVSPANTPTGQRAEWTFTAPGGATIVGLTLDRWSVAQVDPGWLAYIRTAEGQVLESCRAPSGPSVTCETGTVGSAIGAPGYDTATFAGLNTRGLVVGVACDTTSPAGCQNGSPTGPGAPHLVGAAMRNVVVTLSEGTPPQITALGGPAAPGVTWLSGARPVQVNASDVGGGIAQAQVARTDTGQILGSAAAACPQAAQPCPGQASLAVPIDVRGIPDGASLTVRAGVTDAAGQTTQSTTWGFRVDNSVPRFGSIDRSSIPTTGASVGFRISDPSPASPVIRADWRVTPVDADQPVISAATFTGTNITRVPVRMPRVGQWRVRMTITDAAGNTSPQITDASWVGPAVRIRTIRFGRVLLLPSFGPFPRAQRYRVGLKVGKRTIRRTIRVRAGGTQLRIPLPGSFGRTGQTLTARYGLIGRRATVAARIRIPSPPPRRS